MSCHGMSSSFVSLAPCTTLYGIRMEGYTWDAKPCVCVCFIKMGNHMCASLKGALCVCLVKRGSLCVCVLHYKGETHVCLVERRSLYAWVRLIERGEHMYGRIHLGSETTPTTQNMGLEMAENGEPKGACLRSPCRPLPAKQNHKSNGV